MRASPVVDGWVAGPQMDGEIARCLFEGRDGPRYSADIGDAWKIVDELQARGYVIRVAAYPKEPAPRPSGPETRVTCRIEQTARGVHRRIADADAPDAPLAICRAALQACRSR